MQPQEVSAWRPCSRSIHHITSTTQEPCLDAAAALCTAYVYAGGHGARRRCKEEEQRGGARRRRMKLISVKKERKERFVFG